MDTHLTLGPRRLPPLARGFHLDDWIRGLRGVGTPEDFARGLAEWLSAEQISFHASGREALRVLFTELAQADRHAEVGLPAYTCFSVAAAAVSAGLRVRLLDVDRDGCIARRSWHETPKEKLRAVVVCNLFGLAEDLPPIESGLRDQLIVVEDAAQSLGAQGSEGRVGARGDVGVLSFARGKPLAGLGGGALCWRRTRSSGFDPLPHPRFRPARALARGLVYEWARHPRIFPWLCRVPGLGIGETHFEPDFARGAIDGAALLQAAMNFRRFDRDAAKRRELALRLGHDIRAESAFRPLLDGEGRRGVFPRLAVVSPDPESRDRALSELGPLGASRLYPSSLARISRLRRYLVGELQTPGADELADRLLTIPVHERVAERDQARIVEVLSQLAPRA